MGFSSVILHRGDFDGPLTLAVGSRFGGRSSDRNHDLFSGIGRTPDLEGRVSLENHVAVENSGHFNFATCECGEGRSSNQGEFSCEVHLLFLLSFKYHGQFALSNKGVSSTQGDLMSSINRVRALAGLLKSAISSDIDFKNLIMPSRSCRSFVISCKGLIILEIQAF
jgi:hypothetical protein